MNQLLMADQVNIRELRDNISKYVNQKSKLRIVTVRGKNAQVMVPYADMVELLEIMEEIRDAELRRDIKDGRAAYQENRKGVSARKFWERFK